MKDNPLRGVQFAFHGLRLIFHPGIRRYVVVPLIINTAIFSALLWASASWLDGLLQQLLPTDSWLASLSWLLWPLFALAGLLVVFFGFTALANLIASPFNGLLAEKLERILDGQAPGDQTAGTSLLRNLLPALGSELRKLRYFLLRAIPLLLLFLIPGANLAAPFLWIGFTAWYLAIEYADFPMGNHDILFPEQHRRLARHRWSALGLGAGLLLIMSVPVLNFLAMPAGVAGATLLWHEKLGAE